jgi:peptidyl-prolyl cis-trans isomerase C
MTTGITMNRKLIVACIIPLLFSACSGDGKTTATDSGKEKNQTSITNAQDGNTVAVVNGKAISEELFEAYIKQRQANLPAGTTRQRILDELINFELVIQDALSKGLDKKPDIATQLQLQRRNTLASAAFREYVKENPLSDEQMRKDYESRMEELTLTEYKLRHILTEDEATAKKALAELEKGADITKLVEKYSSNLTPSGDGDLGWQSEPDLLPAIRDKVKTLKKGEHANEAVKTRFGWHIIYLEDRRDTPPPPFEQVKERVRNILQRRQIEEYIVSLRTDAKVDITKPGEVSPKQIPKPLQPNGKPDIMMNNY